MFLKQAIENVKFSTVVFKEANGHAAQNALARRGGGRREEVAWSREEGSRREEGRGGRGYEGECVTCSYFTMISIEPSGWNHENMLHAGMSP